MIYFDNNATTLIDPQVLEAMNQVSLANPSSPHRYGQRAKQLLADAKSTILNALAPGREIIFTSSATEALNMVIQAAQGHIITSSLEHAAVLEACRGKEVTILEPKEGKGAIEPDQVEAAILPNTSLIVLMAANNETGIKSELQDFGIPLLIDAVAIVGKESWQLPDGICACAISAHKIHGPQGAGALIFDKRFPIKPLIRGGQQQRGLRGGTENMPAIVGFAKAVELMSWTQVSELRDYFEEQLHNALIHGKDQPRICNTSSVAFEGVDGEELLMQLDLNGFAVSYGSACSSASLQLSHVLLSMGIDPQIVRSTLRFSFSRYTTREEIDQLVTFLTAIDLIPSRLVSSAVSSN
ncbi:MAG: Cysteine desulfurase NifS [Chlamydiales bacterium]|nr:Cysteine desulfurase NifS [Chlamydiales bacterium]MCH9635171.1 Cysteine desulfurase NifS [Chlamydiales bacterium]MCH9703402.1 cysteine desulfurase [Chlamydiota bacterium]